MERCRRRGGVPLRRLAPARLIDPDEANAGIDC
jgi:hypothetical protein